MEHLTGASLGLAQALPANIRLGWKDLPGRSFLDISLEFFKSQLPVMATTLFTAPRYSA